MSYTILIIGNHPICSNLKEQYTANGYDVARIVDYSSAVETDINSYHEICLLADYYKEVMEADNEVMDLLAQIAIAYDPLLHGKKRLLCHLLLRSQPLLHMLRLEGFSTNLENVLEINPFTIEDQWAQALTLQLDREPITIRSEKTVHLVIFGMNQMAELVAFNAAHVCHYPNNIMKDHSLRTRITIIDEDAIKKSAELIQRYYYLFENCYYRFVDPQNNSKVTRTYPPRYKTREDFVDIEWEFVSSTPYDSLVRNKIKQWAINPLQLLTIVFAGDNTESVLSDATHLPEEIKSEKIPVFMYMKNDIAFMQIQHNDSLGILCPFGMTDRGYDVHLPLLKMAKNVNYIYNKCSVIKKDDGTWEMEYVVEIDEEEKETLWQKLPFNKRMSSLYNALTIGVKMRSMGFKEDEWEKFYDISQEEIEVLAHVEHNRWCVEELLMGWRPCNEEEQHEVEADISKKEELKKRKVHYDLRSYNDLRPDATGETVKNLDRCLSACIPLIAKESKVSI